MTRIQSKTSNEQIFAQPVRRLSAEELEKVVGGDYTPPGKGMKNSGAKDNQNKGFD